MLFVKHTAEAIDLGLSRSFSRPVRVRARSIS